MADYQRKKTKQVVVVGMLMLMIVVAAFLAAVLVDLVFLSITDIIHTFRRYKAWAV
jgi:hypothetical protein